MKEILRKIVELATYAPSGDNAQPWRFAVKGNEIHIYNVRRDTTVYNFRERGSYVAHGALIENILIASSQFGYHAVVALFPDEKNSDFVAMVSFEQAAPKQEALYSFIEKRATNRKPYKLTSLSGAQKNTLLSVPREIGFGELLLIEHEEKKRELAEAVSQCDRLIFENKAIHDFLFAHVNWTAEEEEKRRSGLYLKTLELAPPQVAVFKLFKKWGMAKFLSVLGLPKFIAKENAKLYATSSAIGAIVMNGSAHEDFVMAGRVMQRMWLKITQMGLSMQPITASAYLAQRVFAGETAELSKEQISIIKESYEKTKKVFGVESETIAFIFRTGNGGEPSGKSMRLPPEIRFY